MIDTSKIDTSSFTDLQLKLYNYFIDDFLPNYINKHKSDFFIDLNLNISEPIQTNAYSTPIYAYSSDTNYNFHDFYLTYYSSSYFYLNNNLDYIYRTSYLIKGEYLLNESFNFLTQQGEFKSGIKITNPNNARRFVFTTLDIPDNLSSYNFIKVDKCSFNDTLSGCVNEGVIDSNNSDITINDFNNYSNNMTTFIFCTCVVILFVFLVKVLNKLFGGN